MYYSKEIAENIFKENLGKIKNIIYVITSIVKNRKWNTRVL